MSLEPYEAQPGAHPRVDSAAPQVFRIACIVQGGDNGQSADEGVEGPWEDDAHQEIHPQGKTPETQDAQCSPAQGGEDQPSGCASTLVRPDGLECLVHRST